MSQHDLPGEIKPKKFFRALARLGFVIDTTGGKGSHTKAVWKNQKSITIPNHLPRQVLRYILKEIEEISSVTWEMIEKEL